MYVIETDDGFLFPAIDTTLGMVNYDVNIEIDFEGYQDSEKSSEFFDYEFLYRPIDFLNLSGGCWKVFRKNVRRFKRNSCDLSYHEIHPTTFKKFFVSWLSNRESFYEPEKVLRWADHYNVHLFGLFDCGKLIGANGYDWNFRFVNFRYSFAIPEIFGSSEYLRYMFYLMLSDGQFVVNDGGSVGMESLYKFKMKLNPVSVLKRYSWNEHDN
jgi:hypothetical protein